MLGGMDILHDLKIDADTRSVFEAVSRPDGLNRWWTESSLGDPRYGAEYAFVFGEAVWRGMVLECRHPESIVWEMVEADEDWLGTRFGFRLASVDASGEATQVRFFHRGWRDANAHYRRTSYCWAMYLNLLKGFLEDERVVEFHDRSF